MRQQQEYRPAYRTRVALICPRCDSGIPLTELASWINAYASGELWSETCPHCAMVVHLRLECVGTEPPIPADQYPTDHPLGWPTALPHPKYAAADRRAEKEKPA